MWITGGRIIQIEWTADAKVLRQNDGLCAFQRQAGVQRARGELWRGDQQYQGTSFPRAILGTLAFTLNEMGSHCMVLGGEVTQLCFLF